MSRRVLLYGATGFSGRALATALHAAGVDLVLAGRDAARLAPLADSLGVPWRAFPLDDPDAIDAGLHGIAIVMHAAGPFAITAAPMLRAAIRAGVDYLDLAGEWQVFRDALALDDRARAAGSMLLPGVGFGIAITDCLLALAARTPDTVALRLGVSRPHAMSRGSLRTMAGMNGPSVMVSRGGALVAEPVGTLWHDFDFGAGDERAVAVTWPDVVTAPVSTGIGDVAVFWQAGTLSRLGFPLAAAAYPITNSRAVQGLAAAAIDLLPEHPRPAALRNAGYVLVADAIDRWRRAHRLTLTTGDGYAMSTHTATALVSAVATGTRRPGFVTPSQLLGAEFVLGLPGTRIEGKMHGPLS